jgi:hypothetical protein
MPNAYDVTNNAELAIGPPFAFTDVATWLEGNGCMLDETAGFRGVEVVEAVDNTGEEHAETGDTIPSASISYGKKKSRPLGSKLAKRRKVSIEN